MTAPSDRPFRLFFGKKPDRATQLFTDFTEDGTDLPEKPGAVFEENSDIYVRFEGPRDFRFTMDGLDIVSLPGAEREDGQTWLRPGKEEVLLFSGQDFPLVPGCCVLTVEGRGRTWYGVLEIEPRYLGKQSWQDMRDELAAEIRNLSFDFIRRTIHISRSFDSTLSLSSDLLLRFYTVESHSRQVLSALDELSRSANVHLMLRRRSYRPGSPDESGTHRRRGSERDAGDGRKSALFTEITRNVPENRFVKTLLLSLDRSLLSFIREIDRNTARLEARQQEIRLYTKSQEYRIGKEALARFGKFRRDALRLRGRIRQLSSAPWFAEAEGQLPREIPAAVYRDPRYSVLYRLRKNLEHPGRSLEISSFYQFQWKRTDKLYELWGFLQFVKALSAKGWELEKGISVEEEDGTYRLSGLEPGTALTFTREDETVRLLYDTSVPGSSADTNRDTEPLYSNNLHRTPDLRLDYYRKGLYCGSLVADFKYRDLLFLWQNEARSQSLRTQINAYRDMNTPFYRDLSETESLRDARPVKEVWAVFPREAPAGADRDYSLRFLSLAPNLPGNARLPDLLEEYIESLR